MNSKRVWHWVIVSLLIFTSLCLGGWLDRQAIWIQWRYRAYQALQRTNVRQPEVMRTALVLVTDEEYWKGELARRVPLKRDYLAKLLIALERADPAAIVIDFDLRSPMQDGPLKDHKDYRLENRKFFEAIRSVSAKCPIVLPAAMQSATNGEYDVERSIYDGELDCEDCHIGMGYAEVPQDVRRVPIPLRLKDGLLINSLASAVVRFVNKDLHQMITRQAVDSNETLPFGSFIPAKSFPVTSATHVLKADPKLLTSELRQRVVIIGAGWSRLSYGRGGLGETIVTPAGTMAEVYVQANYIEALLDRRTSAAPSDHLAKIIEVFFALAFAWLFSRKDGALIKALIFLGFLFVIPIFTYVLLQNFGIYFDFFIPLVLLGGHAAIEQVIEWRGAATRERLWEKSRVFDHERSQNEWWP